MIPGRFLARARLPHSLWTGAVFQGSMAMYRRFGTVLEATVVCLIVTAGIAADEGITYSFDVLLPEQKTVTDEVTGAELTFLTTDSGADTTLYFHERSWLADESLIVFTSTRDGGGLMGFISSTGELVRLATPSGGLSRATAAVTGPRFYALRDREVLELTLAIAPAASSQGPSRVEARERVICTLPQGHGTALNESCDGKHLALGMSDVANETGPVILMIDVASGTITTLVRIPAEPGYGGHVQWSRTNPNLLSFAGRPQRLQVVDIRDGKVRTPYVQGENELVTHESWWVDDQMLFCGGTHPKPAEDSHVKVLNVYTGEVRVAGPGAWWAGGSAEALAKVNWWHAAGSEDGKWVAADNWHGDIMLFEGKTTRPHLLTGGHRTYGSGDHPHVSWDRKGEKVVFTSHRFGNPDVCVARIPSAWRDALP